MFNERTGHLTEGLHHVIHVHVAQDDAQSVTPLQLLYPVVHILRLQQVKPVAMTRRDHPCCQVYGWCRDWVQGGRLSDAILRKCRSRSWAWQFCTCLNVAPCVKQHDRQFGIRGIGKHRGDTLPEGAGLSWHIDAAVTCAQDAAR